MICRRAAALSRPLDPAGHVAWTRDPDLLPVPGRGLVRPHVPRQAGGGKGERDIEDPRISVHRSRWIQDLVKGGRD